MRSKAVLARSGRRPDGDAFAVAARIVRDVRSEGDRALRRYAERLDRLGGRPLRVNAAELQAARRSLPAPVLGALDAAAARIESFARAELRAAGRGFRLRGGGIEVGQRALPVASAGVYVPGGRYPLPSTALMGIIPARVAGVARVVVTSPDPAPAVLAACALAGASEVYRVGGAQAIAALAFGTPTIPRVDIIVGPGNRYVAAAKHLVSPYCGIDLPAGPSEVLVIADGRAAARVAAAELLAQAEHDPDAVPWLVTPSAALARRVAVAIRHELRDLASAPVVRTALRNGGLVITRSLAGAIAFANRRAPEHLVVLTARPAAVVRRLTSYGALFVGPYSTTVLGDYCTGPNHTLPTGGAARFTGGLGVRNFLRFISYQKLSRKGFARLVPVAAALAELEGLEAHRRALVTRREPPRRRRARRRPRGGE